MLQFRPNRYRGIEIVGTLPEPTSVFARKLEATLAHCTVEQLEHVWLTIPIQQAVLISEATRLGFDFHHCTDGTQSGTATLTLVKRLTADAYVLHAPSHYIGVGAVVLNERDELLVVREVIHANFPGRYKLPGGYVDPGEHIGEAVVREVAEETGVETAFRSMHAFRHQHGSSAFGYSNLYFICQLEPLTYVTVPEDGEILEAIWLPIEQFLAMDTVKAHPKGMVRAVLNSAESCTTIQGINGYCEIGDKEIELFMPIAK